jgi:ketosteroid isomerase-like protein
MKMFSMRLISFVMIIGLFAGGCGGGDSPGSVVRRYYAALAKGDAKTLGVVMTPRGVENLTPFMEKAKDHVTALGEITDVEETIDGDTGVVKVTFKNGSSEEIDVVKVDGKWKVSEWDSSPF